MRRFDEFNFYKGRLPIYEEESVLRSIAFMVKRAKLNGGSFVFPAPYNKHFSCTYDEVEDLSITVSPDTVSVVLKGTDRDALEKSFNMDEPKP